MLHKITGRAKKCGPSAISAIVGVPTHDAAATLRRLTGRRAINGVCFRYMHAAFVEYGFKATDFFFHQKTNLNTWAGMPFAWMKRHNARQENHTLASFLDTKPDGTWLLCVKCHWIVYSDGKIADSGWMFSRKPTAWTDSKLHRKVRIISAMRLKFNA